MFCVFTEVWLKIIFEFWESKQKRNNTVYKETVRNWCDYSQCASLAQYSNEKRNADDRCHWGYGTIYPQ